MRVMLMTLPNEGEPRDYTTPEYYSVGKLKYIPLGILAVAGGIDKNRYEVRIFDAASAGLSIDETIREINNWAPDVLGMTASIGTVYSMSRILSEVTGPKKAVGGPHCTHYSKHILQLGADAVFIHDGDVSFASWLENGCPGGVYKDYIKDLDALPMPNLDYIRLEDYAISEEGSKKVLLKNKGLRFPMYSSKGCPFRCVFCDIQDKKFRYKSARRVVDEMAFYTDWGAESVHIMDDCFNVKQSRVIEICDEIKRRGLRLKWSARGRATINYETARALKDAGCLRLHVGVESFDPDILKAMNKKITIEQMLEFFSICKEVGIQSLAYLIIGFPGETTEYRKKLPQMIRDAGVDLPFFNILYPLPHSDFYRNLLEDGIYEKDFWEEYALNPVPDFQPPPYTSAELHKELIETAKAYVDEFYPGQNQ